MSEVAKRSGQASRARSGHARRGDPRPPWPMSVAVAERIRLLAMTVSSSSKGEDGDANRSGRNWHTQMVGDLEIEGASVEVEIAPHGPRGSSSGPVWPSS